MQVSRVSVRLLGSRLRFIASVKAIQQRKRSINPKKFYKPSRPNLQLYGLRIQERVIRLHEILSLSICPHENSP